MADFSDFAKGEIKKNFDNTVKKINQSIEDLKEPNVQIQLSQNLLNTNFSYFPEEDCQNILRYLEKLNKWRLKLINFLESTSELQEENIFLKESILEKLCSAISKAEMTKTEIENMIKPEIINSLKKDQRELESLQIANSRLNEIYRYIDYLNNLDKFNAMMSKLDHGAISNKGNSIITNSLKESFLREIFIELTNLGGEKIPLFVNSSTQHGKPTFQLTLKGVNISKEYKIDSILSEGEQTIASLAGFLAELKTANHQNGIILDDPVNSLDHLFKSKIAKRLVKEARSRQVVIFTHDIAFLFDLKYFATEFDVPTHLQNIRKDGNQSGIIYNSNPWHAQDVRSRLQTLNEEANNLNKMRSEKEDYNQKAGAIYGRLRETWERVIEEVLFNKVITRFGQGIQTQRLSEVCVEDEDYKSILLGMSKCSKYMIGHDKSLSLLDDRPKVKEIVQDIKSVNNFLKGIKQKKNDTHKRRKQKFENLPEAQVMD